MSNAKTLRIVAPTAQGTISREQKRFNTLLGQIDKARQTVQAWQQQLPLVAQHHQSLMVPLLTQWHTARRSWVLALHAASAQTGWSAAQRGQLTDLLCEAAAQLLDENEDDAELQAVFAHHAQRDFDAERQEQLQVLKSMAESLTGLDLGDEDTLTSESDLMQRLHQQMQQQQQQAADDHAQREARRGPGQQRRQSAAEKRREAEAQQISQSVRDIYRKLASALHPDRATDAADGASRTALMQEVNQAYEADDLLSLLSLQLRIEQIDAQHLASLDDQQVKRYNKLLQEQLGELKAEINHLELRFCMDFSFEPGRGIKPDQLGALLQQGAQQLRGELAQVEQETQLFANKAATKQWLKRQRLDDAGLDDFSHLF